MTRALDLALLNRLGPSDPIQALRDNTQKLTPAQLSNIGGGFVTGAGMADFLGQYPAYPDAEKSTAEMLAGQRELSAAQNFGEGNYVTAGLQGLGAVGDLAAMVPIVGPAVSQGLKAPRALQKYMKMTGESNEIIARQNLRELMEVDPRTGKNEFGLSDTTKAQLEARGFDARDIGELNNVLRPTREQEEIARSQGFDTQIYHGTMKDLDVFDPELLDPNAFGGKGVYGSTTFDDSYHNYANLYGPDNQVKVEKRAVEIVQESNDTIDYDSARNMATKELDQTSNVYNLWARTNKHAIIGDPDNSTIIKGSEEWQITRDNLREKIENKDGLLDEDDIEELNDMLYQHEYDEYGSPLVQLRESLVENGMNDEGIERAMYYVENYSEGDGITTYTINNIIDNLNEYIDESFYPETYHPAGEFKRSVFEDLGFEGIVDKSPKKRFHTMDHLEDDTVHVITFPNFRENVRSAEANFDPDQQFAPEIYMKDGGEVVDDEQRKLSMAQLTNIAGMFAPGAGIADATAGYPEFPSADTSITDMLQGERSNTLAENIEEGGLGGYGMAALQGLGVAGDALYAIPFIGPAAGATVGSVLKAPLAISKAVKAAKNLKGVDAANPNTVAELNKPIFTPLIKESEGVNAVRAAEDSLKSSQMDVSSVDNLMLRASNANPDFQETIQEIAELVGAEKAGPTVKLKDGTDLEIELKTRKSMENKLERKKKLPNEITDSLRTSIYIDTAEQGDEIVNLLSAQYPLVDRGFQLYPTGYFDRTLNIIVDSAQGPVVAELQILNKPMANVKTQGHRLYDVERELIKRYGGETNIPNSHIKRFEAMRNKQIEIYGDAQRKSDAKLLENMIEKFKKGGAVELRQFGQVCP